MHHFSILVRNEIQNLESTKICMIPIIKTPLFIDNYIQRELRQIDDIKYEKDLYQLIFFQPMGGISIQTVLFTQNHQYIYIFISILLTEPPKL